MPFQLSSPSRHAIIGRLAGFLTVFGFSPCGLGAVLGDRAFVLSRLGEFSKKKGPRPPGPFTGEKGKLHLRHVGGLFTLGAVDDIKLDFLAFRE